MILKQKNTMTRRKESTKKQVIHWAIAVSTEDAILPLGTENTKEQK